LIYLLLVFRKNVELLVFREEEIASVVDPFGNILGIMYNQHYLQVLESARKA